MIDYDKQLITELGKEILADVILDDENLKGDLTFIEHATLYYEVENLDYEGVVTLLFEDVTAFEGKFGKFLKYGFAAIAGAALGLKAKGLKTGILAGPPLGMFSLYIFRKLRDPCERQCFRKLPLSTKRSICKAECHVDASRKVVQDLRTELAKCRQFLNPRKCEKKLYKEYDKWTKRMQKALVKLRAIRVGQVEKVRKMRGKELAKRARMLSAGIQHDIGKDELIRIISENEQLRESLSFEKHLILYSEAMKL
jgi:hypothetical protein